MGNLSPDGPFLYSSSSCTEEGAGFFVLYQHLWRFQEIEGIAKVEALEELV